MLRTLLFSMLLLSIKVFSQEKTFADHWEFMGVAVSEPGWHIWGCSPIMGPEGKTHLFVARWPEKTEHEGWRSHSEIAHYIGDTPEGPFVFSEVALQGTGKDTWDKYAMHNPAIHKVGNRYVLLYIANNNYEQPPHPANQRIGMAISNSLMGPWEKVGKDGMVLDLPPDKNYYNFQAGNGVVNPAFLQKGDKFYLYFKSNDTRKDRDWRPKMGLAIAQKLEGPYIQLKEPVTENEQVIEDGYAFKYKDKVALLTTDNHGSIEEGGGILWTSNDGLSFNTYEKGFHRLSDHVKLDSSKVVYTKGIRPYVKGERPQVLMINNSPKYLFMPSGTNIFGEHKGSISYVWKFNE